MSRVTINFCILFTALLFGVCSLNAQTTNDFRSIADGNWNVVGNWQRHNGTGWEAATYYPDNVATANVTIANAITANVALVLPANLTISGTLTLTTLNFSVGGTTSISGSFVDNSNTGVTTFSGAVSLTGTATWTSTAITTAGNMVFQGGIVQGSTGSFSAGAATLTTNSQSISIANSTGNVSFSGAVAVNTNLTLTNSGDGTGAGSLSFNGTVTIADNISIANQRYTIVAGTLNGDGADAEWINGADATLEYNAAAVPMITGSLDATANGNAVFYNRNGDQTLKVSDYFHLSTGTNGVETNRNKTFEGIAGTFTIGGNLFIGNRSVFYLGTGAKDITVNGSITLETSNTWFRTQNSDVAHSLTVGGVIVNNGGEFRLRYDNNNRYCDLTMTGDGDLIQGSGTGVFRLRNLTLTGAGATTISYDGIIDFYGGQGTNAFTNNNVAFTATNGTIRFAEATTFEINGTGSITFNNLSSGIGNAAYIVILNRNITVNGLFYIQSNGSGYLDLNGYTLNIYGDFNRQNTGQFRGSATSVLNLGNGNAPTITNTILFQASYQELSELNHNVTNGFTLGTALAVNKLNVVDGTLTTGQNFTIRETFSNEGSYSQTANTTLFDHTGQTISIDGDGTHTFWNMEIVDATTVTTSKSINIQSNFVNSSNAVTSFNQTAGTTYFNRNAAQSIGGAGSGAITFNNLVVSDGNTKTLQGNATVNGDFTIATGTSFNPNTFDFNVSGNTIIAGTFADGDVAGATNLQAVDLSGGTINGGANGIVNILGNLTMPTANATIGRVELTVTGTTTVPSGQTLTVNSANGAKTFNGNVTVNDALTISAAPPLTFGGNLTVGATGSFINSGNASPTISSNLTVNSGATFTQGTGTYTFDGASKEINGDIGTLTLANFAATGTITSLVDNLTVTGTLTVTDPGTFTNGEIVNVATLTGTGTFIQTADAELYISTNSAISTLNASVNSNLVEYTSAGAENVTSATYHNLTVRNGNTKTLQGNATVNGDYTIATGTSFNPNTFDFTVSGNTFVAGTFADGNLAGTTNLQAVDLSGGTINGGANGIVNILGNITMPTGDATIGRAALTITGTTTVPNGRTLNLTSNNGAKVFVGKVTVEGPGGNWVNSGNVAPEFRNGLEFNGTTFTSGTGVYSFTTNNQSIGGSSAMTFSGAVTVGAGVNLTNSNSEATTGVTINGVLNGSDGSSTFTNQGTLNYNSATIPMANGSLETTFNSNSFNYTLGGNQNVAGTSYYNLGFATSNNKTLQGEVTVANTLTLADAANLICGTNNLTLNGPVFYTSSGNLTTGTNTVTYGRSGDQDIINATYSGQLVISGSGTKSLLGNTTVTGAVSVNGGTLNLNSKILTTSNAISIASGATLNVNDNAQLLIANGQTLTNSGAFRAVGTSGNEAIVSRNAAGTFSIVQPTAGAVFHAQHYQFDYLNDGIIISDGSIDATNNFSYGSFANCTGAQVLNLTGIDVSGLGNVVSTEFNTGTTYNLTRTSGTGTITFEDASGALAGENFDNDNGNPGNLIDWVYPSSTYYSTGNFSAGLTTSWKSNPDGSGLNPTSITDGLATLIVQDGHTVTLDNNGDIDVLALQVGEGTSGIFRIGQDATQRTLTVREKFEVKAGASVTVVSAGSPSHTVVMDGNLINNGTFNLRTTSSNVANIVFNGGSSLIAGSSSTVFNTVTFKSGSNVTADVSLDINNNVVIENNAVFNDGGQTHYVYGKWTTDGTAQLTGSGTIVFDGVVNVIENGSAASFTFNNVIFNGGGVVSIQENLIFTGDFEMDNSTTCNIANQSITIGGNFTINSGSQYSHSANTTTFNGTTAQTLDFSGTVSFYNLTFSNGGANAKTVSGDITANNRVTISSGATVTGGGTHTITGGLLIDGTCNLSGTINLKGNSLLTNHASNVINLGTAVLNIEGDVSLTYGGAATALQVNVFEDVNVNGGNLTLPLNTSLAGQADKEFNLTAGRVLLLQGEDNFPTGFGAYNLNKTSRVDYERNGNQTVRGNITYGILRLEIAGTKIADEPITAMGELQMYNGITFDLQNFSHSFASNITNTGLSTMNGGNATVTLSGNDNQTVGAGIYTFNNLNITLSAGSSTTTKAFNTGSTITINNDLNVSNTLGSPSLYLIVNFNDNGIGGTPNDFNLGSYCQFNTTHPTIGISAFNNFTGTISLHTTSNFYYSRNGAQDIASGFTYGNLWFNGGNKSATGDIYISGNIKQEAGTPVLYDAGNTIYLAGNWLLNNTAYYTQASATGTVVFNGNDQEIQGVNFNSIVVNNTGTLTSQSNLTVYGNLTVENGAKFDANIRNITIGGNWTVNGTGLFTQSTGTTTFNGAAIQIITSNADSYFGLLTVNKPNAVGSQTVSVLSEIHINGRLNITENAGVLDISNQNVYLGGYFYVYNNTVEAGSPFISTNSTVYFNGADAQRIYNADGSELTFHNIVLTGAGDKTFGREASASTIVDVNGNFTINSSTVSGNGGWGGGVTWVDFQVAGDWVNTGSFVHGNARTVTFDGADQNIGSSAFGSAIFSGTDTKTLTGNINLGGYLTIENNVTLDAANNNIMLAGTWTNNAANSVFVPGTGTVTFEGATADIFAGSGAGKHFYNLVANKNVGQTTDMETDLVVTNNLTISSGNLRTQTNNLTVGGDFVVSGGIFEHNNNASRLTLNASGGTKLFDPGASGTTFRGVTINAPGSTYNVQNDFTISQNQDFIVEDGYFSLNGNKMTVITVGQRIVLNGGTFEVDEGATVSFSNNTQQILNQGGTLRLVGTLASNALLTRTGGNFTINQTSGTLHATYYKIDLCNGFTISGGTIDGTNNLNNGTFSNGSGNAYLTLTGLDFADFNTQNVFFGSGPTYNVSRTSGTGKITFEDSFGAKAGEIYDQDNADPGTLIDWTFPTGFFWDGGAVTDNWHEQDNWSGNAVPDGSNLVILNHDYVAGNYTVSITSQDAEVNRLILDDQATTNGIELVLENSYDLTVNENFQIGDNTTVTQTDNTNIISIGQSFVNDGALNNGNSTVTFNGPAGSFTISTGTGAGKSFHNFVINANEGTNYNLTDPLDVDNDFTITKGTLNLSSSANNLTVGGNWTIDLVSGGAFTHANATVTLDGTDQDISGGTFYNLTTSNSGTKQLQTNIGVEQSLTIGSGTTLDAQEYTMYVSRNWTNNGDFSQSGLGQVVFDGTAAQLIDNGTTATDFNSISFSNGGAKTFYNNSDVNGDFTINNGSGIVDVDTYTITGVGVDNSFTNNASLYVKGANNFPSEFENIEMAVNSWVDYRGTIDQTVYSTTYGNLRLRSTPATTTKTAAGDLVILGQIDLDDDALTTLDMSATDANITIAGNITVVTDAINWGTGSSTLNHNGADWNIDAQLEIFNNIILSGSGSKWMYGNLTITGDVTVKNGVYLRMYTNNNRANSRTMTGNPAKTFTLENGARVYCAIDDGSGSAIPFNFGTYNLGTNSNYYLFSPDGVNQTISSAINYGNLYMNGVKNVTSDGVGSLNVKGEFDINNSTYYDNGKNINIAGAYAYFTNYTPSAPTVVVNLNGTVNQRISDDVNNNVLIGSLISSGSASKTLGDGNDAITIQGDVTINSGTTVTSARNIAFAGSTFTNSGSFTHTATFTLNGSVNQNVNPGVSHNFNNVDFNNANTVTFTTNGADINGTFTISQGTVNLGSLSHTIAGTITNTAGGTLTSNLATITLDGGNQNVNTPAFSVDNITISGTGTKRLFSNWTVGGDLTINSGTILNTYNNVGLPYHNISLGGNWNNSGTFTDNTSTVTFNGISSPVTIASNESEFYDVVLSPLAPASYNLTSTSTRFANSLSIDANATLNLNSNTIILGRNVAGGKTFTVNGTLNVNENAYLLFDNRGSQSVLNVNGTLRVLGSSSSEVATISRSIAGVAGSETQINILSGGTLEAQYYLIEYLQDAGLIMASGSTLHSTNNLSNGTWSNIRNAANVRYLDMECNYAGGVISNITFNYTGTPTQGTHFNVRRETATPDIVFDNVAGNLGSYLYEDDEEATPSASSGKLQWPAITVTNWTGAINSNWHIAGNWDNGVPDETIDAVISNRSNDPYISNSDAECKNLIITDGTLVIENDRDLNAYGDVEIGTGTNTGILAMASSNSVLTCGGYWSLGGNGSTFGHGSATVIFNSGAGSATILPQNSDFYNVKFNNPATTFYISGTTINFKGDFEIVEGIITPITNNYIYSFEGDFSNSGGGTFNQTAGSVTAGTAVFNGSVDQEINNGTFHNLTVSGSGTKTTSGPTTIDNITIVNSTLAASSGSNIDFKGNVTINTGGGFIDGGETHTFTGVNWTGDGSYSGTGTFVFNRIAGNQNIYGGKFNNLNIECTGGNLFLFGEVSIGNNLSIKSGVTNVYLNTYQITNTSGIGTFTMESSVYLRVEGANNFPTGFANYNLGETTRVYYNAATDQQIAPITYGHLYLYNANTKRLTGDIVVNGGIYFYNNTTLDVTENNYGIEVKGVWNNNDGASTFLCREGQVEFSGSSANQNININVLASNEFYDVLVTNQGYNVVANSNVVYTIKNNLHVTSGNFNGNTRNIYIGGDMLASVTGSFSANSTYHLNSTGSGSHLVGTNGTTILNLNINSSGGATYEAQDNISLIGDFNLTAGTFDGNGKTITLGNGNTDIITIAGTYKLGEGGRLAIGDGTTLTVEASGSIEVVGTPSSIATVTRNASGGRYNFTVNGSIAAQYYLFEYMSSSGIFLSGTSTIHATNNFSNGTFTNGATTGQLLRIENTQSFTDASRINNVSFPVNPGGSSNNVAKSTAVSGNLEFYNATGAFSGSTFELDPSNLIAWTGPVTLTWNGSVSTNWNDIPNWTASFGPSIVPTGAQDVFITSAVNQPILTTFGAKTANLTINSGATLILNTPADAGAVDLDINGDLIIAGTLRLNTIGDYITVEGNYSKTGTVIMNGNVTFDGAGSSKTINNGNTPFYNLTIGGTSNYQLAANTTINNNLVINSGSFFDVTTANYSLTVKGNWTNSGTFSSQTGKVTFNASSGTKTITGGVSAFNDIDINASGLTYQLGGDMSVKRNLNLIAGTLELNGNNLNMGDGVGTDYLTITGRLNVNENENLRMGANAAVNVNSSGRIDIVGVDADNVATVTRQSTGYYGFNVNSGGTISAKHYLFEFMNSDGIYIQGGAEVGAAEDLSNGTFQNGFPTGTYLKIEKNYASTEYIRNVVFNSGAQYNVTRTIGDNEVFFIDASGPMGSYLFELDDEGTPDAGSGLLRWSYVNTNVWDGSVSIDWHTPGNWSNGEVPDLTKNAIIPNVDNDPVISTGAALAKRVSLEAGATLGINGQDLTVAEEIYYEGTITVTGSPTITVGEDWTSSSGTFSAGSSTVILNAASGTRDINMGSYSFYNLEINSGGTYRLNENLTIANNLTITGGTLNSNGYNMNVGGSWANSGTFTQGTRTVTFNGASGTHSIDNGGGNLYNLTINSGNGSGNATYRLTNSLTISNNLTLSKGTFDLSSDGGSTSHNLTVGNRISNSGATMLGRAARIQVGENWTITGAGAFTCGTSEVVLTSNAGTRTVNPSTSNFYNLTTSGIAIYRLSRNTIVENNLNIQNGTLDVSSSPSYNLTVGGNWTNSSIFNERVGTVTFNGGEQIIDNASGEMFYSLTINNTSLTLTTGDIVVTNTLNMAAGNIVTGLNSITLGTSTANIGTLSYTAGNIVGGFERWVNSTGTDYIFPVGTATSHNRATLRFMNGLTSGSLLVAFSSNDPGTTGLPLDDGGYIMDNVFTNGYWDVTAKNSLACTDYNITLNATGFTSFTIGNDTRVIKRTNGGAWGLDGSHLAAANPLCYRTSLNGISTLGTQFGLGLQNCFGGAIDIVESTICAGDDLEIFSNTTSPYGGSGYTYTWQSTTTLTAEPGDANWTDIPSSNNETYDHGVLNESRLFVRRAVASTGCVGAQYSNAIEITVNPKPVTGAIYHIPNNFGY